MFQNRLCRLGVSGKRIIRWWKGNKMSYKRYVVKIMLSRIIWIKDNEIISVQYDLFHYNKMWTLGNISFTIFTLPTAEASNACIDIQLRGFK